MTIRARITSFTLIELLLTVAIISILASLLMVSLKKALAASYDIQCRNSMRGVYLASLLYSEDHKRFPSTSYSSSGYISYDSKLGMGYDGRKMSLSDGLMLNSLAAISRTDNPQAMTELYHCASDTGSGLNQSSIPGNRHSDYGPRSYAQNAHLEWELYDSMMSTVSERDQALQSGIVAYRGGQLNAGWSAKPDKLPNSSKIIYLLESMDIGLLGLSYSADMSHTWEQSSSQFYGTVTETLVHNNAWNYMLCDGHIEQLIPEETWGSLSNGISKCYGLWSRENGD